MNIAHLLVVRAPQQPRKTKTKTTRQRQRPKQRQRQTPASGKSSTTAKEGESGDEEANAKDEVAVKDVIRCK